MAAKKTTTALAKWDEELAKRAQAATEAERIESRSTLSMAQGIFTLDGNELDDDRLSMIVINHAHLNTYFLTDYDPDNPGPPDCYALGMTEADMVPHPNAPHPQVGPGSERPDLDSCLRCPHNQWGSAEKGKGKACSNKRRLAVIPADALEEGTLGEVPTTYTQLPVTSVRNWSTYVKTLASVTNRPPLAVVTEVKLTKHVKNQFTVNFRVADQIDDGGAIETLIKRADAEVGESGILYPWAPVDEEEETPPAKPAATKKGKFTAGGRKK